MLQFSPTYITIPEGQNTALLHVTTGTGTITQDNLRVLAASLKPETNSLIASSCPPINMSEFFTVVTNQQRSDITIHNTQNFRNKLNACLQNKQQFIVLRVTGNTPPGSAVSALEQVYIPIFLVPNNSLLLRQQNPEVLGLLSKQFLLSPLSCSSLFSINDQDIVCQGAVTNVTDSLISMTLVAIIRESAQPGLTRYTNPIRTNVTLLPGQEYAYTAVFPRNSYLVGENIFAVQAAFTQTGADLHQPYFAESKQTIWFIPLILLLAATSVFIIFVGILLRKLYIKLTARHNGPEKGSV